MKLPSILRHTISIPFIYAPFFFMIPMDIILEIYHRICFPLYGIPYIQRRKYIKIDRQKLSYLNWIQKINCVYCGYANGLFPYGGAICAATERYWCPIKHQDNGIFEAPKHQDNFAEYGDAEGFKSRYNHFE